MELIRIIPKTEDPDEEKRLWQVLDAAFATYPPCRLIRTAVELGQEIRQGNLKRKRLLFAAALGNDGINLELYAMLRLIRQQDSIHTDGENWSRGCLAGSIGAVLTDASSEYYTKSVGREIVQTANEAGCTFPGRPLTEGTGSLKNYIVRAKNLGCDLYEAYEYAVKDLLARLKDFSEDFSSGGEILCIHACNEASSNTYWLWKQVKQKLSKEIPIREISLREGHVMDCAGCSYETCMYFSQNAECFYGGTIVDEVYPALESCRALVLLCPNYNDALGANLTAFINRLTSPFRRKPFDDKSLFAIIVSGYSGADIVGRQLIDALNMNKSFQLPGNFALTETANAAGSISKVPGIHRKTEAYAAYLEDYILKSGYIPEEE